MLVSLYVKVKPKSSNSSCSEKMRCFEITFRTKLHNYRTVVLWTMQLCQLVSGEYADSIQSLLTLVIARTVSCLDAAYTVLVITKLCYLHHLVYYNVLHYYQKNKRLVQMGRIRYKTLFFCGNDALRVHILGCEMRVIDITCFNLRPIIPQNRS